METSDLTPSAWRTCRVLANVNRLRLLAAVSQGGPLAVSQAALRAGVPEITATLGLRALQSRGLLTSVRDSRWVRYAASPDPLVSHATDFLSVTTHALQQGETPATLAKAFTAFTHPRRVRIVQTLVRSPMDADALSVQCEISPPALRRHLAKLSRRGVVTATNAHTWRLAVPPLPLLRDLVLIILGARRAPDHTFEGVIRNPTAKSEPGLPGKGPELPQTAADLSPATRTTRVRISRRLPRKARTDRRSA